MTDQPFLLGVNYWPRRKAMYWWSGFDELEVREEFSLIRDLGLHLVRIFLLWEDWQPAPERVNPRALEDLGRVCDVAADLGLILEVTFFTGHMSGPSWVPRWMLRRDLPVPPGVRQVVTGGVPVHFGYLNPYVDPIALDAAELLASKVVSHYKDHPAIAMWSLGNEPDLFALPPSAEAGRAWARRMATLIRAIDPAHPITCGLHMESLVKDNGLRVHEIFEEVDLPVMHGYPMYAGELVDPLDTDFVPFLCALTAALCGKPALMEEFGGCTAPPGSPSHVHDWTSYGKPRKQFMASEEDLARYIERVLPKLVEVGALGAVIWCFADYAPERYHRPPCDESWHERFFGLVRPDGSLKPHAEALQRFAATDPRVLPAQKQVALGLPPEDFYRDPLENARRAYRDWLEVTEG
jgi:endo-1,4-beta-mannosidase